MFLFDLGLFQGCVLSCILFSCVFQLLLDMLAPLAEPNGYQFKDSPIVLHDQAFADDLSPVVLPKTESGFNRHRPTFLGVGLP